MSDELEPVIPAPGEAPDDAGQEPETLPVGDAGAPDQGDEGEHPPEWYRERYEALRSTVGRQGNEKHQLTAEKQELETRLARLEQEQQARTPQTQPPQPDPTEVREKLLAPLVQEHFGDLYAIAEVAGADVTDDETLQKLAGRARQRAERELSQQDSHRREAFEIAQAELAPLRYQANVAKAAASVQAEVSDEDMAAVVAASMECSVAEAKQRLLSFNDGELRLVARAAKSTKQTASPLAASQRPVGTGPAGSTAAGAGLGRRAANPVERQKLAEVGFDPDSMERVLAYAKRKAGVR